MELQVEASGETVGEAKWSALRELEKPATRSRQVGGALPGRLRGRARLARGRLHAGAGDRDGAADGGNRSSAATSTDESELAAEARELVERIVDGDRVDAQIDVEEDDETITVACTGPDLGMLIGRHGQTIDAIQYLANASMYRRHADDRKEVVVDAAGYRARRRASLEALAVRSAERCVADREQVELEPMTAVERKVVHIRLKEFDGVETTSEGTEPNRFVVIHPVA